MFNFPAILPICMEDRIGGIVVSNVGVLWEEDWVGFFERRSSERLDFYIRIKPTARFFCETLQVPTQPSFALELFSSNPSQHVYTLELNHSLSNCRKYSLYLE